jgi:hypothetical protein
MIFLMMRTNWKKKMMKNGMKVIMMVLSNKMKMIMSFGIEIARLWMN